MKRSAVRNCNMGGLADTRLHQTLAECNALQFGPGGVWARYIRLLDFESIESGRDLNDTLMMNTPLQLSNLDYPRHWRLSSKKKLFSRLTNWSIHFFMPTIFCPLPLWLPGVANSHRCSQTQIVKDSNQTRQSEAHTNHCLTLVFSGAQKRAEMLCHPCILRDPQTKGDKVRSGCLTPAF